MSTVNHAPMALSCSITPWWAYRCTPLYGHLHAAMDEMRAAGKKVALAHFKYINPLPANTAEVLRKYPKVVVAEQNAGQLAAWLRMKVDGFVPMQYNEVKGQPFEVSTLVNNLAPLLSPQPKVDARRGQSQGGKTQA